MQKLSEKFEPYIKYLVAALLIVIPLYPKFPFISIPGTFVAIRFEDFLIAFALLFSIPLVYTKTKKLRDTVVGSVVLYVVIGLLSVLSGVLITKTVQVHIGVLHLLRRVEYFALLFIGMIAINKKDDLEFYLKVLMVTVTAAFLYGFGQQYLNFPFIVTQNEQYSRGVALRFIAGGHINSTFAGHYDLATFLVLFIPVFLSMLAHFLDKKGHYYTKIALSMISLFGLWLLAVSGSRISVLSYLIATTCAFLIQKRFKVLPLVIAVSLIMFSFSPSLKARYKQIFLVTKAKVETIFSIGGKTSFVAGEVLAQELDNQGVPLKRETNPPTPTPVPPFEDRSTSIRLNVEWPRALRALAKNPLLGTGYSSITLATDNDYLRMLGETGIVGFLAFMLIFIKVANEIAKTAPYSKYYSGIKLAFLYGITGGFVGVFVNAFFIDVFEASKFATMFWLFAGISISLVRKRLSEK